MGFDNLELAEMTNPALSSVSQPGYQLGMTAAQILLDRVAGDEGPPKHCVLQTELTLRESVAPPKRDPSSEAKRRAKTQPGTARIKK